MTTVGRTSGAAVASAGSAERAAEGVVGPSRDGSRSPGQVSRQAQAVTRGGDWIPARYRDCGGRDDGPEGLPCELETGGAEVQPPGDEDADGRDGAEQTPAVDGPIDGAGENEKSEDPEKEKYRAGVASLPKIDGDEQEDVKSRHDEKRALQEEFPIETLVTPPVPSDEDGHAGQEQQTRSHETGSRQQHAARPQPRGEEQDWQETAADEADGNDDFFPKAVVAGCEVIRGVGGGE